jgi:hypothetical protein
MPKENNRMSEQPSKQHNGLTIMIGMVMLITVLFLAISLMNSAASTYEEIATHDSQHDRSEYDSANISSHGGLGGNTASAEHPHNDNPDINSWSAFGRDHPEYLYSRE